MRKLFTLIELIVVIVVIGILAAIIVPNISSLKQEATHTAIEMNLKNLQTSIDIYSMNNHGTLPGISKPTEIKPSQIDFEILNPDYTRDIPKTTGINYWVDFKGKVWASSIDSPIIQMQQGDEDDKVTITWTKDVNATKYNIYQLDNYTGSESMIVGKVNNSKAKYTLVSQVEGNSYLEAKKNTAYVVSGIDEAGFESAPSGIGYTGYENQKPVAVFTIQNEGPITNATPISWTTDGSFDPDGDELKEFEWQLNEENISNDPPLIVSNIGTHIVKFRIQDERGLWSNWSTKEISIVDSNAIPLAVITMTPSSGINTTTNVIWSHSNSTDPDGDNILSAEWELDGLIKANPNGALTEGTHTMKLRVQDSKGAWSESVSKTFVVNPYINQPFSSRSDAAYQTWVVPVTGVYSIHANAGQGGHSNGQSGNGQKGSYVYGEIPLNKGDTLSIKIGLIGQSGSCSGSGTYNHCGGGAGGGSTGILLNNNLILQVKGGNGAYGRSDSYNQYWSSGIKYGGLGYVNGSNTIGTHSSNYKGGSGGGSNSIHSSFTSSIAFANTNVGNGSVRFTLIR